MCVWHDIGTSNLVRLQRPAREAEVQVDLRNCCKFQCQGDWSKPFPSILNSRTLWPPKIYRSNSKQGFLAECLIFGETDCIADLPTFHLFHGQDPCHLPSPAAPHCKAPKRPCISGLRPSWTGPPLQPKRELGPLPVEDTDCVPQAQCRASPLRWPKERAELFQAYTKTWQICSKKNYLLISEVANEQYSVCINIYI